MVREEEIINDVVYKPYRTIHDSGGKEESDSIRNLLILSGVVYIFWKTYKKG